MQAAIREKEIENRTLLYYMDECERQQSVMRKFKHDYQNILISMNSFLDDDDLSGLKQYYTAKIKPASDVIMQGNFSLEQLGKIKVREIKSILAAKLTMAQNLGLDARFEAVDDVDHIPVDSVALVRMLGIILDNAIEELETLGTGQLLVACFKSETSVTFIVQNTCRTDMPSFRQLSQSGFSSKGVDRGTGLSNLSELAATYPNITLQTNVVDRNFIQRLIIGGA